VSTTQDLVILGGGAAGTAAALSAAAAGLSVVLVEPGRFRRSRESETALAELLARRPLAGAPGERRVEGWRGAVRRAGEAAAAADDRRERRLREHGVARVCGTGRLSAEPGEVRLDGHVLRGAHVLVATGSLATPPRGCAAEPAAWLDRARLFDGDRAPASALVVGGGLEGVGLAGLLAAAGTAVVLTSAAGRLLPEADPDLSAAVERSLSAAGVDLRLGRRPEHVDRGESGHRVCLDDGDEMLVSCCLATGARRPDRDTCGLDELGLDLPQVLEPQEYATPRADLVLAGSATGRTLVPEAATREGRAVVARLLGRSEHVPHEAVPKLVAGVASCGWAGASEPDLRARGHALRIGRAQLPGRGRQRPGFVKLLADSNSNRVLGVHAVGAEAREASLLGAVAVEAGLSRLDLVAMAFPEDSAAAALAEAATRAEPA
jgi:dihydrolipoamide dehydrogenase